MGYVKKLLPENFAPEEENILFTPGLKILTSHIKSNKYRMEWKMQLQLTFYNPYPNVYFYTNLGMTPKASPLI